MLARGVLRNQVAHTDSNCLIMKSIKKVENVVKDGLAILDPNNWKIPKNKKGGQYLRLINSAAGKMRFKTKKNDPPMVGMARSQRITQKVPKVGSLPNGSLLVSHRELVDQVYGASGATITDAYGINPGSDYLFSWLSKIAVNYETYRFRKLRFTYATCSPTSNLGSIALAVDYDSKDGLPATRPEFMDNFKAKSCDIWQNLDFDCDVSEQGLSKFIPFKAVRTAHTAVEDIRLSDSGKLLVQTVDPPNANRMGELYVDYLVELHTPAASGNGDMYVHGLNMDTLNNPGFAPGDLFGTSLPAPYGELIAPYYGDLNAYWSYFSPHVYLTFEPGYYLVWLHIVGTTVASAPVVNASSTTYLTITSQYTASSSTSAIGCYIMYANSSVPGSSVAVAGFTASVSAATVTHCYVKICRTGDYMTNLVGAGSNPCALLPSYTYCRKNVPVSMSYHRHRDNCCVGSGIVENSNECVNDDVKTDGGSFSSDDPIVIETNESKCANSPLGRKIGNQSILRSGLSVSRPGTS